MSRAVLPGRSACHGVSSDRNTPRVAAGPRGTLRTVVRRLAAVTRRVNREGPRDDPRVILGEYVRQLIARKHLDNGDVAQAAGIGRTTLWRLIEGDPTVGVKAIVAVEQALDQPFGLFGLVTSRDVRRIEAMSQLDGDLRSWLTNALSDQSTASSNGAGQQTA